MQSMGDIATISGAFRAYVLDLNKIANDIRLLASGPRTGLAEILLPAVQPGSSIMPGKVNPSIAEMVNQVCYQALGLDTTVALAAEAGQLELNVMMPVITHNIVFGLIIVGNATRVFAERCVDGIEADEAQCAYWLERSPALVTALAPKIGYAEAAKLAKEALATGLTVKELVMKKGLLKGAELEEVLDLRAMTELGVPGGKGLPGAAGDQSGSGACSTDRSRNRNRRAVGKARAAAGPSTRCRPARRPGPAFERAVVGMAVEDRIHRVAGERLLQPARAQVRVDLLRLALDRGLDRRVVQQGHPLLGPQPGQRGLELERLVERLLHELLDDLLAPRPQRAPPESSGKPLHPREADALDLAASPSSTCTPASQRIRLTSATLPDS